MTTATLPDPAGVQKANRASYGPFSSTEFLAESAKFYMTLYDSVTLEWLLASPDPGYREMGEALVASGQRSFAPSAERRARMRASIETLAAAN